MILSFSELWEKSEQFHKEIGPPDSAQLLEELLLKINLYKALEQKLETVASEDLEKTKSRLMGEILFTLTGLSLKDNINVFEVLSIALQHRSVDFYSAKYK
jgi:hypothetical protein